MTYAVVEASGLMKGYGRGRGRVNAVREASLVVHPGEIVGIAGRSGSGKSTLLRLLASVERSDAGALLLGGAPVRAMRRDSFVMPIYQDPRTSLDAHWPIWRTVTEPLLAPHRRARDGRRRARDLRRIALDHMAEVGLEGVSPDALPARLSGGQCQRIAIVRALVAEPRLLVADEPTSALDVSVAAGIFQLLARTAAGGTAIVVVSHDRRALSVLCDRVLLMESGTLMQP